MKKTFCRALDLPARGPIDLRIDVPPTAKQCGVRYEIRLDTEQAAEVRRAARALSMSLPAFLEAIFNKSLPVKIGFLPDEEMGPLVQALARSFARLDPRIRQQLKRRARYAGCSSTREYLSLFLNYLHHDDVVVHPRTGRPVGSVAYWRRIETLLGVHRPVWSSDPLDFPGFLDRYPNRDPWLSQVDGQEGVSLEDICLRTPPVNLIAPVFDQPPAYPLTAAA